MLSGPYYDLPPAVMLLSQNSMGTNVTVHLQQYWVLLMLGAQIMGLVLIIDAFNGLYKKFRYNNPQYGEYKILLIIVGVLMFNFNRFIQMAANTLGVGPSGISF